MTTEYDLRLLKGRFKEELDPELEQKVLAPLLDVAFYKWVKQIKEQIEKESDDLVVTDYMEFKTPSSLHYYVINGKIVQVNLSNIYINKAKHQRCKVIDKIYFESIESGMASSLCDNFRDFVRGQSLEDLTSEAREKINPDNISEKYFNFYFSGKE